MKILSFDLGIANLGTSIITDKLEVIYINNFSTNNKLEHRIRLKNIDDYLYSICNSYRPNILVYEKSYSQNTKAGAAITNVEGIILLASTKYPAIEQVHNFNAKQVKKLATKSGNASKQEMIAKANSVFNLTNKNHHIADSLLIGYCYLVNNNLI